MLQSPQTEQIAADTENELYLVYGGKVADPQGDDFIDPGDLEIVGFFAAYNEALDAWRSVSQKHIDEAFVKYRLVRVN
jgi:hypothetical protein